MPDRETALAREAIKRISGLPVELAPLAGDASTRRFFRAVFDYSSSLVVMVYPADDPDKGASFIDVHSLLEGHELPVPSVIEHDPERGTIVVEDLGDVTAESAISGMRESELLELYMQAVDIILSIQNVSTGASSESVAFERAFDVPKLMWEMDFFMTHFVGDYARMKPSKIAEAQLHRFFSEICSELASQPQYLAHRDYHSRNLMVCDNGLVMVDFQDARLGPCQYDLASLLRDSYVGVPEWLTDALVEYFHRKQPGSGTDSPEEFRRIFDVMSLQRNIKALGTFGYQTSIRKTDRFLSSIPRTGRFIATNLHKYDEFKDYLSVTENFIVGPSTGT